MKPPKEGSLAGEGEGAEEEVVEEEEDGVEEVDPGSIEIATVVEGEGFL